jgi:hypothetical protein
LTSQIISTHEYHLKQHRSIKIQGINVCCNSAIETFTTASAAKLHPTAKLPQIESLQSCVNAVSTVASNSCTEQFDATKECLTTNKRQWAKCEELKKGLDLCLVKNKAGELAN